MTLPTIGPFPVGVNDPGRKKATEANNGVRGKAADCATTLKAAKLSQAVQPIGG